MKILILVALLLFAIA
jgi:hypothetical protein